MSLPYLTDPSLPSNPAPIFSDTAAVRGDHMRANNAEIWANFAEIESWLTEFATDSIVENTPGNGVDIELINVKDDEINIPSGGEVNYNGDPVAGFLDDGTPFFQHLYSVTMTGTNYSGSVAHGLGNVLTDSKILSAVGCMSSVGSTKYYHFYYDNNGNALNGIKLIVIDDTNITITCGSTGTSSTRTYKILLTYIK